MGEKSELLQIRQLFDVLLPLSEDRRKDYLVFHRELPSGVVGQTQSLLQADHGKGALPPLEELLSASETIVSEPPNGGLPTTPYS
jgi:hypothetical protein